LVVEVDLAVEVDLVLQVGSVQQGQLEVLEFQVDLEQQVGLEEFLMGH
jgi:hypothetical protein